MRRLALLLLLAACPKKNGDARESDQVRPSAAAPADATVALAPAPPVPAMPAGLPPPPENAAITPEAVALGELLFWDPRLSTNKRVSCATCHDPQHGFAGDSQAQNVGGKPNLRRAPALVNIAWQKEYGWDGRYTSLAELLAAHVRGQLGDDLSSAMTRISEVPGYRAHFARLGGAATADAAITALSAYVLTRYAGNAPWDRLERAPDVPADMKAGYAVFTGKAQCSVCHTPPLYTDNQYHRIGLIKVPDEGRGRVDSTKQGAFKTPTLRGAAVRVAFFHDASAKTLDEAIDWHLAGGVGHNADPSIVEVKKVTLTAQERVQLGAFVRALTDAMVPNMKPPLP
ncbi:MAG: cytochrome-c peroxidase [Myxococcota bacterium]|nr:cytochrome-c peroxidase [Myxococcota bacterium]